MVAADDATKQTTLSIDWRSNKQQTNIKQRLQSLCELM
jgi:hypothetical protein